MNAVSYTSKHTLNEPMEYCQTVGACVHRSPLVEFQPKTCVRILSWQIIFLALSRIHSRHRRRAIIPVAVASFRASRLNLLIRGFSGHKGFTFICSPNMNIWMVSTVFTSLKLLTIDWHNVFRYRGTDKRPIPWTISRTLFDVIDSSWNNVAFAMNYG